MQEIHSKLKQSFRWYDQWHKHPRHQHAHWFGLFVFILLTTSFISAQVVFFYAERLEAQAQITQPTLQDLWDGTAKFQEIGQITPASSHRIVPSNGTWYDFYSEWLGATLPGCGAAEIRIVLRSSTNKGQSWSSNEIVAKAIPNDPLMGCMMVDPDAFYDTETNTWHVLTQCIGPAGGWNMCHFSKNGVSPTGGGFIADSANPVTRPGQLWNEICQPGTSCDSTSPGMGSMEPGTPEIIYKKNGYYYVTFHGAEGIHSWRGAAKTTDFRNWVARAPDLPTDAIFSQQDCQSWNPGCIGGGAATILVDKGYHYMLIEAPTDSIGCVDGQKWYFGLMRASGLNPTGQWQSYSGNPLLTHSATSLCLGLQYARFFQENGVTYLSYEQRELGVIRLFQLCPLSGCIASTPVITSVQPSSGNSGSTIMISGSNFTSLPGNAVNVSFFNSVGTRSSYSGTFISATSISITVPSDLSPGSYTIGVWNGSILSNKVSFEITNTPTSTPGVINWAPFTPLWAPATPNGWWAKLSPDNGRYVSYGNGESFVTDLQNNPGGRITLTDPDGRGCYAGFWIQDSKLSVWCRNPINANMSDRYEASTGVWDMVNQQDGVDQNGITLASGNAIDAADGHWGSGLGVGGRIVFDDKIIATGYFWDIKIGNGGYLSVADTVNSIQIFHNGQPHRRLELPGGVSSSDINNDYFSYVRNGSAKLFGSGPNGEAYDMSAAPTGDSYGSMKIFSVDGELWIGSVIMHRGATRANDNTYVLLQKWCSREGIFVNMFPSRPIPNQDNTWGLTDLDVVYDSNAQEFVIASFTNIGELRVTRVSRNAPVSSVTGLSTDTACGGGISGNSVPPTINGVNPLTVPLGGTIEIYGENLPRTIRFTNISDQTTTEISGWLNSSSDTLTVSIPSNFSPGLYTIEVTGPNGSATSPDILTIVDNSSTLGVSAMGITIPGSTMTFGQLISSSLSYAVYGLGIAIFIMILYAGFLWMTSAANPGNIALAKRYITNAIIGAVLLLSSYIILYTINPDLVGGTLTLPGISPQPTVSIPPIPPGPGATCPASVNQYNKPDNGCAGCVAMDAGISRKSGVGGIKDPSPLVASNVNSGLVIMLGQTMGKVDWEVTEAYCPTVSHLDSSHYNGHGIDIAMRSSITAANLDQLCQAAKDSGFAVINEYYALRGSNFSVCPPVATYVTTTGNNLHLEQ